MFKIRESFSFPNIYCLKNEYIYKVKAISLIHSKKINITFFFYIYKLKNKNVLLN